MKKNDRLFNRLHRNELVLDTMTYTLDIAVSLQDKQPYDVTNNWKISILTSDINNKERKISKLMFLLDKAENKV